MKRQLNKRGLLVIIVAAFYLVGGNTAWGQAFPEVMFILDGSGSMWGDVEGDSKIVIAKKIMTEIVPELPADVKVGLAAYGHHRKGDCQDIEIIIPAGSDDREALLSEVKAISPKGKTPIAAAIQMVAEELAEKENETTIVLLSDGEETCHPEPCAAVKKLKARGINFILYVVGFDVNDLQKEQLACLAKAAGGQYFSAENPDALLAAFESVKETVAKKVEEAKTTTQKATTRLGKLNIEMPAAATVSINKFQIIRQADGKVLKTIEDPPADSTHPLLSGDYELTAGFANSNFKPDTDVSFGTYTVSGGETTKVHLGAMAVNIADTLKGIPAGAVIITQADGGGMTLNLPYTGNNYYFYKTKPLPPDTYNFSVHYQKMYLYQTDPTPVVLAKEIEVAAGEETLVTVDSGIKIKEPAESGLIRWTLVPVDGDTLALDIKAASNGDHPLWKTYAVMPGTYNLSGYLEGMTEPLPLGENLEISEGDLLKFDTGL